VEGSDLARPQMQDGLLPRLRSVIYRVFGRDDKFECQIISLGDALVTTPRSLIHVAGSAEIRASLRRAKAVLLFTRDVVIGLELPPGLAQIVAEYCCAPPEFRIVNLENLDYSWYRTLRDAHSKNGVDVTSSTNRAVATAATTWLVRGLAVPRIRIAPLFASLREHPGLVFETAGRPLVRTTYNTEVQKAGVVRGLCEFFHLSEREGLALERHVNVNSFYVDCMPNWVDADLLLLPQEQPGAEAKERNDPRLCLASLLRRVSGARPEWVDKLADDLTAGKIILSQAVQIAEEQYKAALESHRAAVVVKGLSMSAHE
jgi:hypothetical protein